MVSRWNSSGIFSQDQKYVAAQRRSQKFTVQIGINTRQLHRNNHMYVHVQRHFLWIKKRQLRRMLANAKLVSLYAKRCGKGKWSFIGPGSETKCYSIREDRPQGIWDKIAEKMLLEFAESGHPIFPRYDSIVQRSTQKQRTWCAVDTLCDWPGEDWDNFSHNCFCKPAQSLRSSRRDMWRVWIPSRKNGATCLWWGNQSCSVRSRQKFLWIVMTQRIKIFYCNNMKNELRTCHNKISWVNFVWMQDFWVCCWEWTLFHDERHWRIWIQFHAVACREYTLPREEAASQPKGWIQGNTKIGPVLDWKLRPVACMVKYGVEVRIRSLNEDNTHSWVRICHGSNKFVIDSSNNDTKVPEDQLEEHALQLDAKDCACRSKAKAKTKKKRTCWLFTKNRSHGKKELNRYWTVEIFSLRIRGIEESNLSSSSFTTSASRRRRSGSFLENEGKSSESIPTIYSLDWRSMESHVWQQEEE